MIVAFSVSMPRSVEAMAAQNCVPLYSSNIIYRIMDHVRERVTALLPVTVEKRVTGEATVSQLFPIQLKAKQTMMVAGCRVANGVLDKSKNVRVVRDGTTIYDGESTFYVDSIRDTERPDQDRLTRCDT
jgi:translation initiation factor IF-2